MIKLIDHEILSLNDIEDQIKLPINRKNSINMILASNALNNILGRLSSLLKGDMIDVIFCTGEGELLQTYKFYQAIAKQGIARPTFFQNSLHNSTLGTTTIPFDNLSSGTTISSGDISFERAIDICISDTSLNPCLILGVDSYPDELIGIKSAGYSSKTELSTGLNAGLFIRETHKSFNSFNAMIIKDINIVSSDNSQLAFPKYYPSNTLSLLIENYCPSKKEISIARPNGNESIFEMYL